MKEQQPWSGKVIGFLQERYINQRTSTGTADEISLSEPVLRPLRTKGIIRGLPLAWKEAEAIFSISSYPAYRFSVVRKTMTAINLAMGGTELLLTATGINICKLDEGGHWKPMNAFFNYLDKV